MTRVLNAERREPVSGKRGLPSWFLHGYGAEMVPIMLGLAARLAESSLAPHTLFGAADAVPKTCAGAPWDSSGFSPIRGSEQFVGRGSRRA